MVSSSSIGDCENIFEPKSSRMMQYPESFMREVKEIFPDETKLHQMIEEGDCHIGELLSSRIPEITERDVLRANSLEELQRKANDILKKKEVYHKWLDLCRDQNIH